MIVAGDALVVLLFTGMVIATGVSGFFEADRALAVCGLLSAVLLLTALGLSRSWDPSVLGHGSVEFLRLGRAVVGADVLLALGGLMFLVSSVRIWVFLLLPLTGLLCLCSRYALRKWLHRRREAGAHVQPVLAVGGEAALTDLIRRTRRDPYFGWKIIGVCTPAGATADGRAVVDGVPVLGDLDSVSELVHENEPAVVAVCRAPGWGPRRLHHLAWDLEDTDAELAVDPGLMEIAGPRMHIAPVDGIPLLRLSRPRFTGVARLVKAVADRFVAVLLLVVVAPVMIAVALAVKVSDGGPVLFRQQRIGARGRTFKMIKFRSMCVDAEARLGSLASFNDGVGPLFKMRTDPRVTRVGAFLRRYSLDELPQLFNVVAGSMSLVGPRPPLPSEVDTYSDGARRRLLVRPGMTGLWQVSGRSSLSWEESVRLDLRYVENWSIALDFTILWKTFGAVVRGRGAF